MLGNRDREEAIEILRYFKMEEREAARATDTILTAIANFHLLRKEVILRLEEEGCATMVALNKGEYVGNVLRALQPVAQNYDLLGLLFAGNARAASILIREAVKG